jgi:type 2 lantibiotic biosynthesis protein LanM
MILELEMPREVNAVPATGGPPVAPLADREEAQVRAELRQIACRAKTLAERRPAPGAPCSVPTSEARRSPGIERRLARWCDQVALGRWELLDRRLSWDGLDREGARRLLAEPVSDPTEPSPDWIGLLEDVLLQVGRRGLPKQRAEGAPVPFDRLLAPFVERASALLEPRLNGRPAALGAGALRSARRALLQRLSTVATPTLYGEFRAFQALARSPFGDDGDERQDGAPDRSYLEFVAHAAAGGLVALFSDYPVLARQLATATACWVDALVELGERWLADAPELAAAFHHGRPLGPITGLRLGLSDPHNGGRGVIEVRFEGDPGGTLIYKPKCLAIDRAYFDLLAWINGTGELPPFRTVRVAPRDGYGWMEAMAARPCDGQASVERYFERAGRLLALVYALEGNDAHAENVIAAGEQPVLIDLETLMSPAAAAQIEDGGLTPATATAACQLADSVLRTGLLPSWSVDGEGRRLDVSALGNDPGQTGPGRARIWEEPNSDRMRLRLAEVPLPPRQNLPTLQDGAAIPCDGQEEAVRCGFRQMYGFLLRHREEMLARPDLLPAWRALRVRYVVRRTRLYGRTLRSLTRPEALRDGADWSLAVEALARLSTFLGERPAGWDLFASEAADLLRLDVPYFTARGDRRDVLDAEGNVLLPERFARTPYEGLVARFESLSEDDLRQQEGYVRAAFRARATGMGATLARGGDAAIADVAAPEVEAVPPISEARCVALAAAVGAELARCAVRGPGGTATWIALDPLADSEVCQVKPIGLNLHSGGAGVGLFLTALARVTGRHEPADLARAALREVRQALRAAGDRLVEAIGLGANLGLGSILYGLATAGELLGDGKMLRDAVAGARWVSDRALREDGKLDVVFGTAGCLLALLKVHRLSGDAEVLEAAMRCGRSLLARRRATPQGPASCPTMDGAFHTGFSHGASGVACALLRLAAASGEQAFAAAAQEMVAWEESLCDEATGAYPDLRRARAGEPPMAAWCHGAPGIALARLEADTWQDQASRCLALTRTAGGAPTDHLCCGNAGRIEVLLEGGRRLGDRSLVAAARRRAAWVAARAEVSGGYRLPSGPATAASSPGLFTGVTGIAYTWLRLARPDLLPCVLLFT